MDIRNTYIYIYTIDINTITDILCIQTKWIHNAAQMHKHKTINHK